jgi:hypothetical protein
MTKPLSEWKGLRVGPGSSRVAGESRLMLGTAVRPFDQMCPRLDRMNRHSVVLPGGRLVGTEERSRLIDVGGQ